MRTPTEPPDASMWSGLVGRVESGKVAPRQGGKEGGKEKESSAEASRRAGRLTRRERETPDRHCARRVQSVGRERRYAQSVSDPTGHTALHVESCEQSGPLNT